MGLLLAGGLLVLIGIVDDRWGMGAISKLAGQIAAGGILVWSGAYLPWIPLPGSETLLLEPDLSFTLTILIVVITINAVNFIDGLDGLAAGVVGISALSYLVYSYTLTNSRRHPVAVGARGGVGRAGGHLHRVPAAQLPPGADLHGRHGAMLLGLLLAYGPISSTASLDQNILVNYSHSHPVNRFPTILPLLLPVAILIIPYTDLLLAVIRRTRAGKSPLAADREHLHHRLLNMGHSHRQSVLIMYLWAAMFSGMVVGLSLDQAPADLARPGHGRRHGRAAPGDDAALAPVACRSQREARASGSQPRPFGRTWTSGRLRRDAAERRGTWCGGVRRAVREQRGVWCGGVWCGSAERPRSRWTASEWRGTGRSPCAGWAAAESAGAGQAAAAPRNAYHSAREWRGSREWCVSRERHDAPERRTAGRDDAAEPGSATRRSRARGARAAIADG